MIIKNISNIEEIKVASDMYPRKMYPLIALSNYPRSKWLRGKVWRN